jgi:hypothetical protein
VPELRRVVVAALLLAVGLAADPAAAATPTRLGSGDNGWVHVDRQGVTHVVWSVTTGLQSELHYRRRPPGGAFSPDRVLPVPASGAEFGGNYVVQDPAPSNRLVLVTERCCTAPSTYALTSIDGGATWSAARPVYEGSPAVNPTSGRVSLVASGPAGIWLIQGNPDIRAALLPSSLDGVVPRDAAALLASAAPYDGSVVHDEGGRPVFAYGDLHRTFVRRGPDGPELLAGDYPQVVSTIKIAGGPRGVVAVVLGGTPSAAFLEARRLAGTTLGPRVRLTPTADANPAVPFLASDPTGRFHLVWRTSDAAVLYRRSENGTAWTATRTVVAGGSSVFDLVAAAGPDGSGWVLWHQAAGPSPLFVAPLAGTAAAPAQPPPPVAGRTVNVAVVSGTVRVRLRGTNRFVDLRRLRQIPTGSELDTLRGRVRLSSAAARGTQSGVFFDGRFVVTQVRRGTRLTSLRLSGSLRCPRRAAAGGAPPPRRRLWGNAKGAFRTRGRYATAVVRGTTWLTEDTCAGTRVRVRTGRVEVFDIVRGRRIQLRAGQSYVARPR